MRTIETAPEVSRPLIEALRNESPLGEPGLEALRTFARAIRNSHGRPSADDIAAFRAAGCAM